MEFTIPWSSLLGGILMGSSGLLLLFLNGKIAGISGILGGLISPDRKDFFWRLLFITGMIGGGGLSIHLPGTPFPENYNASALIIIIAGLQGYLLGWGPGLVMAVPVAMEYAASGVYLFAQSLLPVYL